MAEKPPIIASQWVSLSSVWWIANMGTGWCYKHSRYERQGQGIRMSVPSTQIFWAGLLYSILRTLPTDEHGVVDQ